MTPELIRSLWQLIELFPCYTHQQKDSEAFIDLVITQLQEIHDLEASQIRLVRIYLEQRIPLVCELNESGQFFLSSQSNI